MVQSAATAGRTGIHSARTRKNIRMTLGLIVSQPASKGYFARLPPTAHPWWQFTIAPPGLTFNDRQATMEDGL
jgi:hypothetical protein